MKSMVSLHDDCFLPSSQYTNAFHLVHTGLESETIQKMTRDFPIDLIGTSLNIIT